jgi:cytochrome c556
VRISKQAVASLVALLSVGGAAVVVIAADAYQDRHMAMEAVGDAMKSLGAIAKKQAPFDAAVVKANATTIADHLKEASTLFPAGSGGGESRAKPEIWTDSAGFEKGMKDAQAAAVALQSVSDEAAYGPALGALGGNWRFPAGVRGIPEPPGKASPKA